MKTFAERLKIAIEKKALSQAEAARMAGISQQSINYIINNNLESSKLASRISTALKINSAWLLLGTGRMVETCVYELPILRTPYQLIKFLNNDIDDDLQYTVIEINLGAEAFAFLLEPNKLAICSSITTLQPSQYLKITGLEVKIMESYEAGSFAIYEWRNRDVNF